MRSPRAGLGSQLWNGFDGAEEGHAINRTDLERHPAEETIKDPASTGEPVNERLVGRRNLKPKLDQNSEIDREY